MSTLRLPYSTLSPDAYRGLVSASVALSKSALGNALIDLINLRVSQINGCAFCLQMHAADLRKSGVSDAKLDQLAGWHVSSLFSDSERAALAWAESLTHVAIDHAPDALFEALKDHFDATEISDLTISVALINAFNRLAIGMRQ